MSRVFFTEPLESAATFWRLHRRDGVTIGLTTHDRDLWFGGVLHRASPGMLPSAVRRTAGLAPDSAEVSGTLSDDCLSEADLAAGRFDGAGVEIGVVDWETYESEILYRGTMGDVSVQAGAFEAELQSAKRALDIDVVPRTSPSCRALFCGPGCNLSSARFTHDAVLEAVDPQEDRLTFAGIEEGAGFRGGWLRWLDGPQTGLRHNIVDASGAALTVAEALDATLAPGARAQLREGCDHTLRTCADRFANAANFRGEPFLPGNDFLARYPTASSP